MDNKVDIKINSLLSEIGQKAYTIAELNEAIFKLQQENKKLKEEQSNK